MIWFLHYISNLYNSQEKRVIRCLWLSFILFGSIGFLALRPNLLIRLSHFLKNKPTEILK